MIVNVYGAGELVKSFDGLTQWELAIKVARAICRSGRSVVFEEVVDSVATYVGPNYTRSDKPIEWPARIVRAPGRPKVEKPYAPPMPRGRPRVPGQVVTVRLPDAAIAKAIDLGMGDIKAGIIAAINQAQSADTDN